MILPPPPQGASAYTAATQTATLGSESGIPFSSSGSTRSLLNIPRMPVGIGTEIVDFAGAGHNGDNAGDNDDDNAGGNDDDDGGSEEERSQILLTPNRANQGDTTINVDDSSMLDEPSATNEDTSAEDDTINPNEIIHDLIRNNEDFDKYQTAQMNYVAKKKAMLDERTEVNVGKGAALTTWKVVDDIMERDLPDPVPYFKNIGITGFHSPRRR